MYQAHNRDAACKSINEGKTSLGIELGSTRIKAVLIDENFTPIAAGSHYWENQLEDGIWTYHLDNVWTGLQNCFHNLSLDVKNNYNLEISSVGAIGVSAMMHGYLAFDRDGVQLAQFRTWRNTTTGKAASLLTEKLKFNIPLRWSIAHLYQAMLDDEPHVKNIDYLTTLAGYVHWKLTGKKALGIDDASGMFPVDSITQNYDCQMLKQFNEFASGLNYSWNINEILPDIIKAGDTAGSLTQEGAMLLNPEGLLKAGIPFCPPEGDAGTGMVATNSIAERTGNISAGTSIFAMIVLEKNLSKVYPEIDIVATPDGKPVAMVHCNNCTSDIDAWVKLLSEAAEITGNKNNDKTAFYAALYSKALEADIDCGGLLSYNYISGEPITGLKEGRPVFTRLADSKFTLANFIRTMLFSAFGTLKYGMDILTEKENVRIDSLLGHGGLFKTKGAGQKLLSGALNTPVSVMEASAAEGGAWGIALLAAFMLYKRHSNKGLTLEQFLSNNVFANLESIKVYPASDDVKSFKIFMQRYTAGMEIERAAVKNFKG
ncbi:MAG: FGGY-family carbohydrate kinase [Treponema sp.]|nr:FGGY-family carbohydrate kinase [Treponema sp.]